MAKTLYSVGFLYNDDYVLLIRKNRPEWQAGFLNGVGGHVEPGETHYDCMVREFHEEAGVPHSGWEHFLTLNGTKSVIQCFASYDTYDVMRRVSAQTDEQLEFVPIFMMPVTETVPNLQWIIPIMLQRDQYHPITINFKD